jgi:hypothetical protein
MAHKKVHKKKMKPDTKRTVGTYSVNNNFQDQKNLDGSKDWHVYRERGRFGSFPSFEPMDDD